MLAVQWIIKSFISDSGVSRCLSSSMKSCQANFLVCKKDKNLRPFVVRITPKNASYTLIIYAGLDNLVFLVTLAFSITVTYITIVIYIYIYTYIYHKRFIESILQSGTLFFRVGVFNFFFFFLTPWIPSDIW